MRRGTPLLFLVMILMSMPEALSANILETYGFGSRPIGMGGAYCAVADDFAAVWYNPAGLSQIDKVDLGVGMNSIDARFKSIKGVTVGDNPAGDPELGELDTHIHDNGGFTGGFSVGITEKLGMGLGIYVPSNRFIARLQTQNQREPHFVMYENRPERLVILLSGGVEVLKGFSIGAGANILFGPAGKMDFEIGVGNEGNGELSLEFRPRVSPYAGLHYKIRDDMSIGVVYREYLEHGDLDINMDAEVDAQLVLIPIAGQLHSMVFYSPRQVTLGWAWNPGERSLVSFDLTWLEWSEFEDASLGMIMRLGQNGAILPFEAVLDPDFRDTFLPRAGIEYQLKKWHDLSRVKAVDLTLRGGYYFVDSPVPEQSGITNYMDSDSHVFSTGLGVTLQSPFEIDRTFHMNLHLQYHYLEEREHDKDMDMMDLDGDGSPETRIMGYPGYVTGGEIISGGFTLGVSF